MTYRPTVRYHPIYKEYVDQLFYATDLDRNQIIRCALFIAAHSSTFLKIMKQYQTKDVPLPSPLWDLDQRDLWKEQHPDIKKGGRDVTNVNHRGKATSQESESLVKRTKSTGAIQNQTIIPRTTERRNGEIPSERSIGGITIRIG